ncbi:inositol monophosphatase [Gammaproteobacteria bacterium]|nr:inositol monophosphatase [Gammaproteobacteria bacterium]MDA9268483.1 inositol monophosphatase [Gammaproteobacteria bacterium]MDB4094971.1 inositol monophosphatase [Gammaproteobacteria bacterium]MDB9900401.1 inositol monophosphatase [Gammaproteobacteria bacterium]MDC1359185.1 inositol monophosphatase [Gammaproteobacteria bacterium]|tara:strand:- start:205 stop:948 length:744 start_codon:yes stop_codon:yes gene_type:complete
MIELDTWLEIAKSAALDGGNYLLANQGEDLEVLLNEGRDIKLQLDTDTENLIKKTLRSKSSFSILGEETGLSGDLGEFYWVIDPLDGTSNFLRGIPISCVSIALMRNLNPILGVIYDFNHDDLYFGHQESRAFLNQREICVSNYSLKNESTLVTGIPAKQHYTDEEFKNMINDFQNWKKIRMIGSAAMASIYVAAGKAETYKENGIFLWDIAAGAAIVNAAGGVASITNIQADYRVDAIFTNKNLAC